MLFAVVDIETTGGSANNSKITEIAVIITDGKEILDSYESLDDPGIHIPNFITNLTGITNQMVEGAPDFNHIAQRVSELLNDKIFVAHNVNFDYSFVKKQLDEAGFPITDKKMCTVKYSRKVTPGHKSYSLANNCLRLGITNNAAHRAMGDTKATTILLHKLLVLDTIEEWKTQVYGKQKELNLPTHLESQVFNNLPEEPGVYYMKDKLGKIQYIGKAKNIKARIQQHFSGSKTDSKSQALYRTIADIHTVLTGTEFLALLVEDSEIRKHWPPLNKAQKSNPTKFHLSYYKDQNNNWRLCIVKGKLTGQKLLTVFSWLEAREILMELVKQHQLHPDYCQVKLPVNEDVTEEFHNYNFQTMVDSYVQDPINFVIWEEGLSPNETAFILIKDGLFFGHGFIPNDKTSTNYTQLQPYVTPSIPSGMSAKYVASYLQSKSNLSISIIQYQENMLLF